MKEGSTQCVGNDAVGYSLGHPRTNSLATPSQFFYIPFLITLPMSVSFVFGKSELLDGICGNAGFFQLIPVWQFVLWLVL